MKHTMPAIRRFVFTALFLGFCLVFCYGQKSIEIQVNSKPNIYGHQVGTPISPGAAYNLNRWQFFSACEIFLGTWRGSKKVFGGNAGARYFLRSLERRTNLFVESDVHYSRFAYGTVTPVHYNYYTDKIPEINMIQMKSIIHTVGFGCRIRFLNFCEYYFSFGEGYNRYSAQFSPYNPNFTKSAAARMGKGDLLCWYLRMGLGFRVFKREKTPTKYN